MTDINENMKYKQRRTCPLNVLWNAIDFVEDLSGDDPEITAIVFDSRKVCPGALFVAVDGALADGHNFIGKAITAGAAAVVANHLPEGVDASAVHLALVPDTRMALGLLASRFFGDPSEELSLVGVTGTNGKTTIATLLYELAGFSGIKAGLLSTVANYIDTEKIPADHTTPDPVELNSLLRRMVDAGCRFAAMEVSSHAADQKRIAGLTFAGGVFTNLTRDHLDYHKTFEAYLKAKKSFFDMLPADAFALVNADDRNGAVMVQNTAARRYTYSHRDIADIMVKLVEERLDGMVLDIDNFQIDMPFTGKFNASNIAAVYGVARIFFGLEPMDALQAMSLLRPVAGRFEAFRSSKGVTAIVDYAHTPDALINVLDTINDIVDDDASVITVCGCGGDRDKGKRPLMAKAAADRSSLLIITSDNPRSEEPMTIINDMLGGLSCDQCETVIIEPDRAKAIALAIASAHSGDAVLVAGKGHETYQIFADGTHYFSDREEVCKALEIV